MSVRVVIGADVLTSFGPALDDLHAAVGVPICARTPWLRTWAECYDNYQPWAVLIENEGRLDAAALLARRRRRGVLDIVALGDGQTDYIRLPTRSFEASQALGQGLVAALKETPGPWRVRVSSLPVDDPVAEFLAREMSHSRMSPDATCPALGFGAKRTLTEHLGRSSRKARNLAINRMHRAGLDPCYQHLSESTEIAQILPEMELVHRRRDASLGHAPLDKRWWSFWRKVIAEHARRHEVEIATLHLNGKLAAYAVFFLDDRVCRAWNTRFDPVWARYSPGVRVNEAAVEWALRQDSIHEFDWMRGQEEYKMHLSNKKTSLAAILAWSSTASRALSESEERAYLWARRVRARATK
ncbi:MAG: GNAT family N-acetyltransferase [Acidimicrobiales bacterium]